MSTKETKTDKTILRVLLAGVVLLLFCGAAVGAAAGDSVCYVGDSSHPYGTVQAAINAVKDGSVSGTIYMTATSTEDITIDETTITLDLNNQVLKGTGSGSVITITNNGQLTLTDSAGTKTEKYFLVSNGAQTLNNKWEYYTPTQENPTPSDAKTENTIALGDIDSYDGAKGWAQKTGDGDAWHYVYQYVTVTGGCITGGVGKGGEDSQSGGGVCVSGHWDPMYGGTFAMSGGNIVGNTADSNGGGVYTGSNSTFNMSGGNIAGNHAADGGGVFTQGSFTMSDGAKIIGNSANLGGGVKVAGGSSTMSGGSITGNTATNGGESNGGGGVYVEYGTFTMNDEDASITGNSATENGGGVYVKEDGNCEFEMSNGTISGNKVGGATATNVYGGGVYFAGTTFTFSGGTIGGTGANDGNIAICSNPSMTGGVGGTSSGGGVYLKSGEFTMSGSAKIIGNKAIMTENQGAEKYGNSECNGGGVFVAGGEFTMSDTAEISSNIVESNASGGGGGVCVANDGSFTMSDTAEISNNTVTVVFSSNNYSVKVHGGGGVKVCMAPETPFTMSGDAEITGNSVTTRSGIERAIVTQGGGVYVYNQGSQFVTIAMSGSAKITGNHAEHGGGVYVGQKSTLKVSGAPVISGNTKTNGTTANNVYLDDYFTPQPLITVSGALTGGEIKLAHPLSGKFGQAGTEVQANSEYTITKADLSRFGTDSTPLLDRVILENGKGLYFGGVAEIKETGSYYPSVASAYKEAADGQTIIMIANSSEPTIVVNDETKDVTLDLNGKVLRYGGTENSGSVIKVSGGKLTVTDNSTAVNYFQVSGFKETVPPVTPPTAELKTPWEYAGSDTPSDAAAENTLALSDIKSYNGENGWAQEVNGKYTYKYVKVTGGVITGGDNTGLTSKSKISSVYVDGGTFTLEGGNLVGNYSANGGGVCVTGGMFEMKRGNIVGNTVSSSGGGVSVASGVFKMSGGNIVGNYGKGSHGGGVCVDGGTFEMTGGKIVGNTADSNGGGVYAKNTFEVSGNPVIKDNVVNTAANNVYLDDVDILKLTGNFTGEIYIKSINGAEPSGTAPFGTAENSGLTGAANFISDNIVDGKHYVGVLDGTTLNWSGSPATFYTITVDTDAAGQLIPSASSAAEGAQISLAPAPGYKMSNPGAYKTDTPSESITITNNTFKMPGCNVTVTATCDPIKYQIFYCDQGGAPYTGDNESSLVKNHTYGTQTTLVAGTKAGYTFDGWFTERNFFGKPVTTLGATDYTADITLYAKWTKNSSGGSSSSPSGSSVWLTETPEPTAAPTPTPTPGTEVPTVKPLPTQAGKTPVPFMGVIAGLGAAAVVFGLRRK